MVAGGTRGSWARAVVVVRPLALWVFLTHPTDVLTVRARHATVIEVQLHLNCQGVFEGLALRPNVANSC